MNKTIQGIFLLRADPTLNARIVGVLAKAQEIHGGRVHAFVCLSNHWHLHATFDSPKQMADFHCYLGTHISIEAGRVHDWSGKLFEGRYNHVELSDEHEIHFERLKHVLSQGCKEGLVASPLDWPGASSTWSLVSGEPWMGEWVDRTAYGNALRRGEEVWEEDFIERLEVKLSPIPPLEHLSASEYRQVTVDLVRQIEDETAEMHRVDGTSPMGVEAVLAQDPHHRPNTTKTSVRPWFFALSDEEREAMRTALLYIHVQYRQAAERLREGDRKVKFPVFTFPPALPFVEGPGGNPSKWPAPVQDVEILEPG